MATMLASMESREVCRCDECGLTQFVPRAGLSAPCRRCHIALDYQESPAPKALTAVHEMARGPSAQLPVTTKTLRIRLGLSQRQLAGRMSVPRTYVSKIENSRATPTLSSLARLARALEVTVPELLADPERFRQKQIVELLSDRFVSELAPFVAKLSEIQMRELAVTIHAMAMRPRRAMA